MNIKVIPYARIDGIPTFKDSQIKAIFERFVADGTAPVVFYDGGVKTADDFLRFMTSPGVMMFGTYRDGELVGVFWLTHFENKSARLHGAMFSNGWGKDTGEVGKATKEALFNFKNSSGAYLIDVLYGFTPVSNTLACGFLDRVGMKRVGVVPISDLSGNIINALMTYDMR